MNSNLRRILVPLVILAAACSDGTEPADDVEDAGGDSGVVASDSGPGDMGADARDAAGDVGTPRDGGDEPDAAEDVAEVGDVQVDEGSDAEADAPDMAQPGDLAFDERMVDEVAGAAFVSVADMNDDGKLDLVVSGFGALGFQIPGGTVTIYEQGADLGSWTAVPVVAPADDIKFPNHTTLVDMDGDDDLDILVPSGFLVCTAIPLGQPCGGLSWWENTGAVWERHDIIANGARLFYHGVELVDLDGDDIKDIVTVGEFAAPPLSQEVNEAQLQWLRGTGAGSFEPPEMLSEGGGSFPRVRDLDGDGDLDIASAEFFMEGGSFAWFEQTDDGFTRHVIDDSVGPSIMLQFVPDLLGDGALYAVGSNHSNTAAAEADPWESAIYLYAVPDAPQAQEWTRTKASEGIVSVPGSIFAPQAAPGIFGHGDIDGDGDLDLLVSGDGDPRAFMLLQGDDGAFETQVLREGLAQAGGTQIVDLNGDGTNELVMTGYEAGAVYLYVRR